MRRIRVPLVGLAAVALVVAVAVAGRLFQSEQAEKNRQQPRQAPSVAPGTAPKALQAPRGALSAEGDDDEFDELEADGEGDDEANGEDESEGDTPIAFGANTLVTLRLAVKRISAKRPLGVEVSNANGFAVSGKLSGATTKRVAITSSARRRPKLKEKAFSVGANARKTVKLKPPKKLRQLLQRRGSLILTARVKDPAGNIRTVKKAVSPQLTKKLRR